MGRFTEFMQGRYGNDQLNRLIMILSLVFIFLGLFYNLFSWIALVLLVLANFRIFSRNTAKRYAENAAYLRKTNHLRNWVTKKRNHLTQKKVFRFYQCPSCGQKIRIPKGKGKVMIHCPKCAEEFQKKT